MEGSDPVSRLRIREATGGHTALRTWAWSRNAVPIPPKDPSWSAPFADDEEYLVHRIPARNRGVGVWLAVVTRLATRTASVDRDHVHAADLDESHGQDVMPMGSAVTHASNNNASRHHRALGHAASRQLK